MIRGDFHGGARRGRRVRRSIESDDQPISGHAEMQRARRRAVHVGDVLGHERAEPVDVEVRVLRHQWIERPVDASDANRGERFALILLEHSANAEVARRLMNAEHVRPVRERAVANTGDPKDEAEHVVLRVERSGRESTDVVDRRAATSRGRSRPGRTPTRDAGGRRRRGSPRSSEADECEHPSRPLQRRAPWPRAKSAFVSADQPRITCSRHFCSSRTARETCPYVRTGTAIAYAAASRACRPG